MRILIATLILLVLGACDAQQTAREQAKQVVNGVIEDRFPGTNVAPITDCIIDNASGGEILELAGAAVTGVQTETIVLIFEIAGRQDTVACFANSLGPLLIAQILAGA